MVLPLLFDVWHSLSWRSGSGCYFLLSILCSCVVCTIVAAYWVLNLPLSMLFADILEFALLTYSVRGLFAKFAFVVAEQFRLENA